MRRQTHCGICGSEKRQTFLKSGAEKLVCDKCRNKKSSIWQKNNRERANKKNRDWMKRNYETARRTKRNSELILKYGINIEDYELMVKEQNGVCKICNKKETKKRNNTTWNLSVDHCHKTGKVRGLLCAKCNVGLAKFEENEQQFLNAIKYLKGEL